MTPEEYEISPLNALEGNLQRAVSIAAMINSQYYCSKTLSGMLEEVGRAAARLEKKVRRSMEMVRLPPLERPQRRR